MKKAKVYIDTSVFGGYFDPEFERWSKGLFLDFDKGFYQPVISELVETEISRAPEEVQDFLLNFLIKHPEIIKPNQEIYDLLRGYRNKKILTPKYENDLLHIAFATYANVDVLVSWNFRHIVRFDKIQMFNSVSLEMGYKPIQIYSPREVTKSEEN